MEYVHAVMLLHSAKKPVNEANLKKVIESTGEKPDDAKIKALVASLEGVDIEKAISEAAMPVAAAAPAAGGEGQADAKKAAEEEKKKEEEKEAASAGLGALFG